MLLPENGGGWFPRIGPDGRIACGNVEVFVGRPGAWESRGAGGGPKWLGADCIVFGREFQTIISLDGRPEIPIDSGGFNDVSAAWTGRWNGFRPPSFVGMYEDAKELGSATGIALVRLSPDGQHSAYTDRPQEDVKNLYVDNRGLFTGGITSISVGDQATVWTVATGMYTREVKATRYDGVVYDWTVRDDEGPQAVDGPDGPWVLSVTQDGLILRPGGSRFGYRMDGDWFYEPHCRFVDGQFMIASSDGQGRLGIQYINPTTARVDLRKATAPPVVPPLPVIPPPVETVMLTEEQKNAIRAFALVDPVPHAHDRDIVNDLASEQWVNDELRYGWKLRLAQYLRFKFGDRWGTKGTLPDWPSKEAIAYRRDDGSIDVWDMLSGAATGRPTLSVDDPTHHHVDGYFIEVEPVDHVDEVVQSPIVRPPLPYLKSASSFDWCKGRDARWLTFIESINRPTMRLVTWSVFRDPRATFEEALRDLELGLTDLRARGLKAAITFHTDTKERGDTKEDIRYRTRLINGVCVRFLDVVAAGRLYNEGTHGVEQKFVIDRQFNLELDAMVDPRIPLAWFANHGGEPVSAASAGGSWIAFHSDRSKTPEENAAIMLEAQQRFGKPVVSDEPIGFEQNAIPGKRVNDPEWARRQVDADKVLGGTTYHFTAGIPADVDMLDDVQREAGRIFGGMKPPVEETEVTPEQIAQVIAGAFFEEISDMLGLPKRASVESRRPAVHGWITGIVVFLDEQYIDIFKRRLDLEGAGSRVLLALNGYSRAEIREALLDDYRAGAR